MVIPECLGLQPETAVADANVTDNPSQKMQ